MWWNSKWDLLVWWWCGLHNSNEKSMQTINRNVNTIARGTNYDCNISTRNMLELISEKMSKYMKFKGETLLNWIENNFTSR